MVFSGLSDTRELIADFFETYVTGALSPLAS